tara:strand:+ start:461 stop:643 length:183 start_codon:yes stop_codon:yes gene_type:complete
MESRVIAFFTGKSGTISRFSTLNRQSTQKRAIVGFSGFLQILRLSPYATPDGEVISGEIP